MPEPIRDVSLQVLQAIDKKGSAGFHPRVDGAALGIERTLLDAALDMLRLGGFVEMTDWTQQRGQGYRLTDAGRLAAHKPDLLKRPAPRQPMETISLRGDRSERDKFDEVRQAVLNPGPANVTRALIALNIAVFALVGMDNVRRGNSWGMYFSGGMLPNPWALSPYGFLVEGEWRQLFTYSFLHSGLIHIGMNMYCLFLIGRVMETRWGWRRFLILYFGSGLIAGVTVILTSSAARTVGASGAIAGLLTSIGVWAWANRRYLPPQFLEANYRMLGINLLLLVGIGFVLPNISMAAHVGGAIGGAILSVPLTWMGPTSPIRHRVMGIVSLLLIAGLCVLSLVMVPKPDRIPVRQAELHSRP